MSRELEEALKELALEIAQAYAVIEQQKAVMRQALDALEWYAVNYWRPEAIESAITALREALEET